MIAITAFSSIFHVTHTDIMGGDYDIALCGAHVVAATKNLVRAAYKCSSVLPLGLSTEPTIIRLIGQGG